MWRPQSRVCPCREEVRDQAARCSSKEGMSWTAREGDNSYWRIARIATPMALSQTVGVSSQLAVLGMIGIMGESALYIRSVYTPVAWLYIAITAGLSATVQVAIARCWGRGEKEGIPRYLGGIARVGTVLCLTTGGLLVLLCHVLMDAERVTLAEQPEFRLFLTAMVGTTTAGMLGELCSATLRGMGRSAVAAAITGTYVALYLGIIAVAGIVLHGGLLMVPASGAVAAFIEISLALSVMARAGVLRRSGLIGWLPETLALLRRIALPVSASLFVLAAVNLELMRLMAFAGPAAVAGFGVGYQMQSVVVVPAVGFGSGVAVLMNQRLAVGATTAAKLCFKRGLRLGIAAYALITVIVLVAGSPVADMLVRGAGAAHEASHFVHVVGPSFGCTAVVVIGLTVLEQVGYGLLALAVNAGYFSLMLTVGWLAMGAHHRVPALYAVMAVGAALGLMFSLPLTSHFALRSCQSLRPQPQLSREAVE
jgi:Na+-driven multidrug efflux pump